MCLRIAVMKRCAERCAMQLYRKHLLKYSFTAAELNSIESKDEVFV